MTAKSDIALREAPAPQVEAASETSALLSMIERVAMNPSADLDKMERLLEMRERMEIRAGRQAFLDAFAHLQMELPPVIKRGKGHNIKYARFEDLITTIREPMANRGFSLSFRLEHGDKTIKVTGVLGHAAGHSEQTDIVLPADTSGSKNAVQAWGSSVSYGKRYVAMTLLGIATQDEDDDGNKAGDTSPQPVTKEDVAALKMLIEEAGYTIGRVCEHYSVETLDDLTRKQIEHASALLTTKRNQKAKK